MATVKMGRRVLNEPKVRKPARFVVNDCREDILIFKDYFVFLEWETFLYALFLDED
jgi:hypothetical protein